MRLGMTMPVMEPDLSAQVLRDWALAIDDGPFSSLCFGERMVFDNPDALTLLGAVAAWTTRVRLVTTVVVPQLHDPVMLGKALATGDVLSNGRLTVGLGVGGRVQDYEAVGADPSTQTMRELARRADVLKQVWRGEHGVGPAPVQPGGPPLLVGTMGPKTMRSAAVWSDGLAGVTMDCEPAGITALYDVAREAFAEAGRAAPLLTTSTWFALDDGDGSAREQVRRHLLHYMNWLPVPLVEAIAQTAGFAGTLSELKAFLERMQDLGTDEFHLIPTNSDVRQVEQVASLL